MDNSLKLTNKSRICAFRSLAHRAFLALGLDPGDWCHISKLFIDGKGHGVTPDYTMSDGVTAFKFVYGEAYRSPDVHEWQFGICLLSPLPPGHPTIICMKTAALVPLCREED
jgi:hypothetical protein